MNPLSTNSVNLVKELENDHLNQVIIFLNNQKNFALEQFPPFVLAVNNWEHYFFTKYVNGSVSAFACIIIKKKIFAEILFGPIVSSESNYEQSVKEITKALKRKGIFIVRLMPPKLNIADSGKEFMSSKDHFNWATLHLNIQNEADDIFKRFADRHKWSIKKALREKIIVEEIKDVEAITEFATQYTEMYRSRGLSVDEHEEIIRFKAIFSCFQMYQNGFFLSVKNELKEIIGGVCIRLQGNTAYYFKGYAHPRHRHLPINHIALFKAILYAKQRGKSIFDFGGYSLDTENDTQLRAINHFKEGFKGELLIYPLTRHYYLFPFAKFTHQSITVIKKILSKPSA